MYPYNENNEDRLSIRHENSEPEGCADDSRGSCGPKDGEHHIQRLGDEHSFYTDANFISQSEATEPQQYYNSKEKEQKSKRNKCDKRHQGMSFTKTACLCLVCALLGGILGGLLGINFSSQIPETVERENRPALSQDTSATPASQLSSNGVTAKDIYALGCDQTVGISTEITTRNIFGMVSSGSVTGSGFIITTSGYIMTNYHVIENAYVGGYNVNVMLHSGDVYLADIVGFDIENDVAVLKIDATDLSSVSLGKSGELSVGDTVYAIGNPLGELAYTMTSGIVSATDRVISTDENTALNMFQFDAAVNSGNSGGPVYNASGQVIGVVTAKYSDTGVEGLGFAIPIDEAVYIANDIIENGYVTGKGYLGIGGKTVDSMTAQYYNMPKGVYVTSVETDSCAETAGIQPRDIITQVGDQMVSALNELSSAIKANSAGDSIEIVIWRSGEYLTLTVVLDEYIPDTVTRDQNVKSQQTDEDVNDFPDSNNYGR